MPVSVEQTRIDDIVERATESLSLWFGYRTSVWIRRLRGVSSCKARYGIFDVTAQ